MNKYPSRCNESSACRLNRLYCKKTCGDCYSKYFAEFCIMNITLFEKNRTANMSMHLLVPDSFVSPQ